MTASPAQIAANRLNALKSTGPRTPEGKARSRANALKHGLCATVVVAEDAELVKERTNDYFFALKPQNQFQTWMVDQVAILSIRIDRCERIERRVRDKVSLRAELAWDDDRRLEAEVLGAMLARKPSVTLETLRRTPHGCDWLIRRWSLLEEAAAADTGWTPEQVALAFDLLDMPPAFRGGRHPAGPGQDGAALARAQVAELLERREAVADLDEVERALTEADLNNDGDPELRRLRRYESTLHSRMRWAVAQVHLKSPNTRTLPGLRHGWHGDPIPTPAPEPRLEEEVLAERHPSDSPHPPFDLEPDEYPPPGQKADIPRIVESRKEKRFARAEARRAARRRKAEKLRA